MNLVSSVPTSSSTVNSPIASRSPVILKASSRQVGLSGRSGASTNQNSNPDAASSSQGWQRYAQLFMSTGGPVATGYQGYPENPENSWRFRRFWTRKSNLATSFPYITRLCTSHGESLLDRQNDLWSETDGWLEGSRCEHSYMFFSMSVTLQAAVHLGQDYSQNLRSIKNQPLKSEKQSCRTTEKFVKDQVEKHRFVHDWLEPAYVETIISTVWWSCSCYEIQNLRLCGLGATFHGISTAPVQAWKDKIKWYFGDTLSQRFGSNRRGADGIRVVKFPRIHYIGNSRWNSKDDGGIKVWTWAIQWKDHLHVNVQWHYGEHKEIMKIVWRISRNVAAYAKRFPQGCWSFLGPGCEKSGIGTHVSKPNGEWNSTAEVMMLNFAESGHPVFRATSALERGELKSKGKRKEVHSLQRKWRNRWIDSSHCYFCQSAQYLRAVADLCKEFDPDSRNQTEGEICESLVIPTEIPNANAISQSSTSLAQGDFVARIRTEIRRTSWWSEIVETMLRRWFLEGNWERTFFITIEEGSEVMQTACREYTQPRNLKTSRPRVDSFEYENRPSLGCENLVFTKDVYCIDIMIESLCKDQTVSWVRIVNGINKYVTETSEEIPIENVQLFISTGRLVAKAKPRPKPVVNLSSNQCSYSKKENG